MLLKRYLLLFLGFTTIAFGVSLGISVQYIGLEPWTAAAIGLSDLHFSFVFWNLFFQIFFLLLTIIIEKRLPRIGTFINTFYISVLIDLIIRLDIFPKFDNHIINFLIFIIAVSITSLGASFAITTDLGPGAKTQFYVAIHNKYKIKLSYCKFMMEGIALIIAFIVGGPLFIGTIIFVFVSGWLIGYFVPLINNIFFKNGFNN
jgi:uncharacterized membrane protein YczE